MSETFDALKKFETLNSQLQKQGAYVVRQAWEEHNNSDGFKTTLLNKLEVKLCYGKVKNGIVIFTTPEGAKLKCHPIADYLNIFHSREENAQNAANLIVQNEDNTKKAADIILAKVYQLKFFKGIPFIQEQEIKSVTDVNGPYSQTNTPDGMYDLIFHFKNGGSASIKDVFYTPLDAVIAYERSLTYPIPHKPLGLSRPKPR